MGDDTIEGDLQDMTAKALPGKVSGKYFVPFSTGRPGTRPGIGFEVLLFGIPSQILTVLERVIVVIDEDRKVPWGSVELKTGYFNTVLKISSADLQAATCLEKAKRG